MFIGGTIPVEYALGINAELAQRVSYSDLLNDSDSVMFFLLVFVSILSVLQQ